MIRVPGKRLRLSCVLIGQNSIGTERKTFSTDHAVRLSTPLTLKYNFKSDYCYKCIKAHLIGNFFECNYKTVKTGTLFN